MIALTPILLVAAANAHVGMSERSAQAVRRVVCRRLEENTPSMAAQPEPALDVAMLLHWGHTSHYDAGAGCSSWPMWDVRSANDVGSFAAKHRLLRLEPWVGDLFVLFAPMARGFVRAGVVARVRGRGRLGPSAEYFDVTSIEGDTNDAGEIGGGRVLRVNRRLCPAAGDRFVRWADIGQAGAGDSAVPSRRERLAI